MKRPEWTTARFGQRIENLRKRPWMPRLRQPARSEESEEANGAGAPPPARGRWSTLLAIALLAYQLGVGAQVQAQASLEEIGQNFHNFEHIAEAPDVLAQSGTKWVRLVAWWKWMEPAQGTIDFVEMDAKVQAALEHGLSVLIMFTSIPPWANGSPANCDFWGGECSAPPTSASSFANFAAAVVNRYKADVSSWEIWNEPDHQVFWDGSIQQWVDLIATPGIAAIHTADPASLVLGPSTYSNLSAFQQHTTPICGLLDAVSAHFYLGSATAMLSQIDSSYQPWIALNCNKPLWVTETGIDSAVSGEAQQAVDYVLAYQGSIARPNLAKMFLFQWADAVIDTQGTVAAWGFVETEARLYRPKRSFFEVQDYINGLKSVPNYLVIRDTFANSTARPVAGSLNGTSSEAGGRTWGAVSTVVMGTSEVTTSIGGSQEHEAGVPFNPPVDPAKPVNTVEADVIVTGSDWIGIGFSLSATGGYWGHGQVWAHVGPSGTYTVYADGLAHNLKTGTIPGFQPQGLNHVLIRHNRTTNTLSVVINGSIVLFERDLDDPPVSFTPSLAFAGFHAQTAAGSAAGLAKVDNFRVFSMPDTWIFFDGFESGDTLGWSTTCPPDCS